MIKMKLLFMNKILKIWKLFLTETNSHHTVQIFKSFIYRVSHETWQLVNDLECLLPYTLLYRVSHETWQLVNSLECLFPWFVKLFDTKDQLKYYMGVMLYQNWFQVIKQKICLTKNNYLSNVIFRGTPCSKIFAFIYCI